MIPLLPVDRARRQTAQMSAGPSRRNPESNDDLTCDYWKYCAIDGYCVSAAAAVPRLPARRVALATRGLVRAGIRRTARIISPAIGTAAAKTPCEALLCTNTVGESRSIAPAHSDLIWCFGAPTMATTARRPR